MNQVGESNATTQECYGGLFIRPPVQATLLTNFPRKVLSPCKLRTRIGSSQPSQVAKSSPFIACGAQPQKRMLNLGGMFRFRRRVQ